MIVAVPVSALKVYDGYLKENLLDIFYKHETVFVKTEKGSFTGRIIEIDPRKGTITFDRSQEHFSCIVEMYGSNIVEIKKIPD